jgi:hypothetical protein
MGQRQTSNFMAGRAMAETGSIPVRIPASVCSQVRAIGGVTQRTPGALLAAAWEEYFENHREELENDFETIGRLLREGDTEGLVAFTERGAEARVDAMMRTAGLGD